MNVTSAIAAPPELSGPVGWVVDLMEALGAPGVGLAIALENIFPPLPSEVFLPLAGFTAARGEMSLTAAIVWTTLGSLVGALVLYAVGAALGRDRLRVVVARLPLVSLTDLDRAEAWFARHGSRAVFFGRMIPVVRSLISVPAGVERMPLLRFAALTTAGSLIWNAAFVLAGYGLGESWPVVEAYAGVASKVVVAAVVVALGVFLVRRVTSRRRASGTGPGSGRARAAGTPMPAGRRPSPPRSTGARPPIEAPTERLPRVRRSGPR